MDFCQCFRSFVMRFSVLDVSSKMSKTACYVHNCSKLENSTWLLYLFKVALFRNENSSEWVRVWTDICIYAQGEFAHLVLLAIFDCVDDTKLVKQAVLSVSQMQNTSLVCRLKCFWSPAGICKLTRECREKWLWVAWAKVQVCLNRKEGRHALPQQKKP